MWFACEKEAPQPRRRKSATKTGPTASQASPLFHDDFQFALSLDYFDSDCPGMAFEEEVGTATVNLKVRNPQSENPIRQIRAVKDELFLAAINREAKTGLKQ
jgi:hypothetical protein